MAYWKRRLLSLLLWCGARIANGGERRDFAKIQIVHVFRMVVRMVIGSAQMERGEKMSILIKGIKMLDKSGVITLRVWGNGRVERLEGYHSWLLSGVRAENIPPHGRLIDADALMELIEHDTPLSSVYEKTTRRYLHNAPTIIEAEGE